MEDDEILAVLEDSGSEYQIGSSSDATSSDEFPDIMKKRRNIKQENQGKRCAAPRNVMDVTVTNEEKDEAVPSPKRKRKRRIEMKKSKDCGNEYITRCKHVKEAKCFLPVDQCCKLLCASKITEQQRRKLFDDFWILGDKPLQDQYLADCMNIASTRITRKGRSKSGVEHDRVITVKYNLRCDEREVQVCKKLFLNTFSIGRGRVDVIIQKKHCSETGVIQKDARGCHKPANKKTAEERDKVVSHIKGFPLYESHYSRRDTDKQYLPPNLTLSKMYSMYTEHCTTQSLKPVSKTYYSQVLRSLNISFKKPLIDTCKTCDAFYVSIRNTKDAEDKSEKERQLHAHQEAADLTYDVKREDKERAKSNVNIQCCSFDLQQCLPTPCLSSNVVFYKRQLWTYNLTVHDAKEDRCVCFMWHEATGKRGSNEIASCMYSYLQAIDPKINHIILYSDSCGGQNRNASMSAMMSYAVSSIPHISVIDHKYMVPGHSHLECDADQARIERARKQSDIEISIPHDWLQFVKTVRGKKCFKVVEMNSNTFYNFSDLYSQELVRRHIDTTNQKIHWLNIRWMRYAKSSPFGVINFKESLDQTIPFRMMDLRRNKRGRPSFSDLKLTYTGPIPVSSKKKEDLLSLLPLLDPVYHTFYASLRTNPRERDTLPDVCSSEEEDQ